MKSLPKMTKLILVAFFLSSVLLRSHFCQDQQCPPIYLRYSQKHSCYQPKNSSCPILQSSVMPADIQLILDLHNTYRNLVATGGESRAGGLPQAADMLQLVWDSELAFIAQRRAEQCRYEHDCNECRRVENFPVGQNIGKWDWVCQEGTICDMNSTPNWAEIIKLFYDEVGLFDQKYLNSVEFPPGVVFGHFTQLIWSKTGRIGCGYVAFKKGNGYGQIYVCNYGTKGNIINTPVYEAGTACSDCPVNSCCGKTCNSSEYPGLCRMHNDFQAPIYRSNEIFLFYCDFRTSAEDCSNLVLGSNNWRFVNALGGPFMEIVLNGGETTTLKFQKVIPSVQGLCIIVMYKLGPATDGMNQSGKASVTFEAGNGWSSTVSLPPPSNREFFHFDIDLGWTFDTRVSVLFSVPAGDPPQFFNIQSVKAKSGKCSR